jgi:hypothetical protein
MWCLKRSCRSWGWRQISILVLTGWRDSRREVTVSKRCLVFFFNVVAMDACHLLLGRPWQYARAAMHDGNNNTYSFMFDKVKIVLLPSKEVEHKPSVKIS